MNDAVTIKQVLDKEGFIIHKIKGGSMLPLLEEKQDMVRLEAVKEKDKLKKYDVPLFFDKKTGTLVLHRIIKVKKDHYITYGDNRKNYEIVPFDSVLAVAVGFYKKDKYIPCDDPEYLKYVKERCSSIRKRKLYLRKREIPAELNVLLKLFAQAVKNDGVSMHVEKDIGEDFDWQTLYKEANRHCIGAMLFPYVKKAGCPEPLLTLWSQNADRALRKEILFDAERKCILDEFEKEQIKYILLKGILIKDFYPKKGIREFSDNDFLLEEKDLEKAKKIMLKRGYENKDSEDFVDCPFYKPPVFNFELHKALFRSTLPISKYFKDTWEKAIKDENRQYGYHMTDEDFYIYVMTHFYKHYAVNSGAGLRYFADFYYLNKGLVKTEKFNNKYVNKTFEKIGISEFIKKTTQMTEQLFSGDENLFSDEMFAYILESGMYGTNTHAVANKMKRDGKAKYWITRLFPSKEYMAKNYPSVKKLPILLPFLWVIRLVSAVCSKERRDKFTEERSISKNVENKAQK